MNKIEFDSKGFLDFLVYVKGNLGDLPQVTVADLEEYYRFSFAKSMQTPVMPTVTWDNNLLITSNDTEEISYKVELKFNRLDYAVEVVNKAIAADNADPETMELPGGNPFADEDDLSDRVYNRLKTSVYSRLVAEEVYMTFSAVIADVVSLEFAKDFIDPAAVESALADTPATIVSEITGIPKNTVIKYQKSSTDPNHRDWISDNARILGRWANKRKYGDKYDATVQ